MESKAKTNLYRILPYLLIIVMALCGTYLVFYQGMVKGHDFRFHVGNVLEQYETILNTGSLPEISGILAMGLGHGTRLFYSPIPHLSVTLTALAIRPLGLDVYHAFKIVLVLSVILSGIFMYRFGMHFSNNNKIAALIAAGCFILYPYRIMDAFTRFAYAETLAFAFMPLFFMGLYDICHFKEKDDIKIMPFLEIIIGGSCLFLCHNLTAFYIYLFGIIYLLFNIKSIIRLFHYKKYWISCLSSALLLVGISSIALFSQIELINLGIYGISDDVRMWTDLDHVLKRVEQWKVFSGFLKTDALPHWFKHSFAEGQFFIEFYVYIFGIIGVVFIDQLIRQIKLLNVPAFFIAIPGLFYLLTAFNCRIEIYLAAVIFILAYGFIRFYPKDKLKARPKKDKIWFNPLTYFLIFAIILTMILITNKWPWQILPPIFLKIQFPWRLWSLVQLFISILAGLIIYYFNFKKVPSIVFAGLVGFLLIECNSLADRRACYELQYYPEETQRYEDIWSEEVDYTKLDDGVAIGFNKEYTPLVLLDNTYTPEHENSLWYEIAPKIKYNFYNYEDYSIKPIILQGLGDINVISSFSPKYEMNITTFEKENIVQMPLIYYPGYQINIKDINNNKSYTIKGDNIDGLISFNLTKGDFKVTTNFVGTPTRITSKVFFYSSLTITTVGLVYGLFFEKKYLKKLKTKRA